MYSAAENPVFLHIIRPKMASYMYFEISGRARVLYRSLAFVISVMKMLRRAVEICPAVHEMW